MSIEFPSPSISPLLNNFSRITESLDLFSSSSSFSSRISWSSYICFYNSGTNTSASICSFSLSFFLMFLSLSSVFLNNLWDLPLLTKDLSIQIYQPETIWEDKRRSPIFLSISMDKFLFWIVYFSLSSRIFWTNLINASWSRELATRD